MAEKVAGAKEVVKGIAEKGKALAAKVLEKVKTPTGKAIAAGTAGAAGGAGLGAMLARGGKKKEEDKTASAFVTPGFNGFIAEMAKAAGYKADKAPGEGAGKTKEGKAAAAPTPVGGTKNPKTSNVAPVSSKGGAAHRADPDDEEGYA